MASRNQDERLLRYEDIAERVGVTVQTARQKVSEGDWDLPKVVLGHRTVRFRESDVEDLIERRTSY